MLRKCFPHTSHALQVLAPPTPTRYSQPQAIHDHPTPHHLPLPGGEPSAHQDAQAQAGTSAAAVRAPAGRSPRRQCSTCGSGGGWRGGGCAARVGAALVERWLHVHVSLLTTRL